MHPKAPTTPVPAQPDPPKDVPDRLAPGRLAAVFYVVRALVAYGRHLAEALTTCANTPQFPTVAAAFGTHKLDRIAAHLQRGILRALALERYLFARALKDREIAIVKPRNQATIMLAEDWLAQEAAKAAQPPQPAPQAKPARAPASPRARRIDPDDPYTFYIPTPEELDAEVRRRPIGRTIAAICADLGVVPGFCANGFWVELYEALRWYGGSLNAMWEVWKRREQSFQRERDRRPETWDWNWRDRGKDTVRRVLGCLIGEQPPLGPRDPLLATAPP